MVASVKEEIKMELQAEELRQIYKEQSALQDDFLNIGKNTIAEAQQSLDDTADTLKNSLASPTLDDSEQHEPK
jgi:sec-independent protein translocase protein TatB